MGYAGAYVGSAGAYMGSAGAFMGSAGAYMGLLCEQGLFDPKYITTCSSSLWKYSQLYLSHQPTEH